MKDLLPVLVYLSRWAQEITNNELGAEAEVFSFDIGNSSLLEVLQREKLCCLRRKIMMLFAKEI